MIQNAADTYCVAQAVLMLPLGELCWLPSKLPDAIQGASYHYKTIQGL